MVEGRPKERVLVVEDDASIALGLRINLEAEGYDVVVAEDGEEGLSLAMSSSPDTHLSASSSSQLSCAGCTNVAGLSAEASAAVQSPAHSPSRRIS